jgi:hypothetical protein
MTPQLATDTAEQPLRATGQGVNAPVLPGRPCHGDIRSAARSHAHALHGRWDRHAPGMPMCERLNHALPEPPRDKSMRWEAMRATGLGRTAKAVERADQQTAHTPWHTTAIEQVGILARRHTAHTAFPGNVPSGINVWRSGLQQRGLRRNASHPKAKVTGLPFHPAWACAMQSSCSKRKL